MKIYLGVGHVNLDKFFIGYNLFIKLKIDRWFYRHVHDIVGCLLVAIKLFQTDAHC